MPDFRITDKRSAARTSGLIVPTAAQTQAALRGRLPRDGAAVPAPGDTNRFSRDGQGSHDELREMRLNRRVALKKQAVGGADVQFATGRPRDPMFYWRNNNIPYDVTRDDELKKIRAFCRLLYLTHPIVAACIDVFSKFPLQGMELTSKDEQLTDFYTNLFFDEDGLDYENYLLDVGREYWICMLPGSEVQRDGDSTRIEDVQVGDDVLTHRGRYRRVVRTMENPYEGETYTVRPHYGLPVTMTDEHPVLVRDGSRGTWAKARDVRAGDQVFVPVDRTVEKKTTISVWESLDRADWEVFDSQQTPDPTWTTRHAKHQRARTRKMLQDGIVDGTLLRPLGQQKGRFSALAPEHVLSDEMLRLFGLYLAEGSAGGGDGPSWAFNAQTEQHYFREVQDLIWEVWGLPSTIRQHSVHLYHSNIGRWMASMFGESSKTKRMSRWMTLLPPEKAAIVLRGLFDGDGHAAHRDGATGRSFYRLTTSSPVLRDQVLALIRRAGFIGVVNEHRSVRNGTACTWWTVGPSMAETVPFARYVEWLDADILNEFGTLDSSTPKFAEWVDDGYWVKVYKVDQGQYSGPVYNLTVQEDNSYVCSVAVHNCGEAWPLGSWNETLGVWDDEELLNPDDVEVERSPFLKEPRYLIRLPETLRKVLQERSPRWEYEALMRSYPELQAYASENALMPVSNILLNQLKHKGDTFHQRGLPILMRGFRAIVQEEMLNSALDAIADRLYTPLILAKLGASAQDLGTEQPWVPTPADLEDFNEALDAALAGDFRVLVHHFATDMAPVFGRENMPDLTGDFDRIEDRILQVFGLSKTMLNGADGGETYAADALNRDIVTQLLTHYQRLLKQLFKRRALIVAEAQEHFDYDVRNGKRYVKMEEILEVDEETGEERIVEQPKLLVPELSFDTMTLSDEQQERQFLEALNESGVPVPMHKRILATGLDFDEMIEQRSTEQVALAVAEQETRKEIYKALRDAGLSIPQDLLDDFRPKAAQAQEPESGQAGGQDEPIAGLGMTPTPLPAMNPNPDDVADDGEDEVTPGMPGMPMGQVIMMPNQGIPQPGDQRPPESDEQRAGMPKPAARNPVLKQGSIVRKGIREATREHYVAPDNSQETNPEHHRPEGKFGAPRTLGMRRYVEVVDTEETA